MGIKQSKSVGITSGSTQNITFDSAVTAGSTIAASITAYDSANAVTWSVTDNKNGATTYSPADYVSAVITGTETENCGIVYLTGSAASTGANSFTVSIDFTHGDTGTISECTIYELDPCTLDKHNHASAVSTTSNASVTNGSANTGSSGVALSVMVLYEGNGSCAIAPGTGYTNDGVQQDGFTNNPSSTDHKVYTSIETSSNTYSHSHVNQLGWVAALATFADSTGITLTAASGSFSLTGEATNNGFGNSAANGSYALSGQAATLATGGNVLAAASGSYVLSGQSLNTGLLTALPAGSYSMSGIAATLTSTGGGGDFILLANAGSYNLTGATSSSDLALEVSAGSYALTGEAITLTAGGGTTLSAAAGSYGLSGEAAQFGQSQPLASGTYVLTGEAATLTAGSPSILNADTGIFSLTGESLITGIQLPLAAGSFALTGDSISSDQQMLLETGSYGLSGEAATLDVGGNLILALLSGQYALTGEPIPGTGPPVVGLSPWIVRHRNKRRY